jgi:hypothetical protein
VTSTNLVTPPVRVHVTGLDSISQVIVYVAFLLLNKSTIISYHPVTRAGLLSVSTPDPNSARAKNHIVLTTLAVHHNSS